MGYSAPMSQRSLGQVSARSPRWVSALTLASTAGWLWPVPCWAGPGQGAVGVAPWDDVDPGALEPASRPMTRAQAAPAEEHTAAVSTAGLESGPAPSADLSPAENTPANKVPPPRVDADAQPVAVAVGLGPEAPGSEDEKAIVHALEQSVQMSVDPPTTLRVLRPGAEPRQVCGEGREDLVITVGYLPDRTAPVLLVHDCRLDVPLGVRAKDAATNPDLVGVLWQEHDDLLAAGYEERRRNRLNPKVRSALIIGGATVAIGLALGLILANTLRDEKVVLKVSP